MAYQSRLTCYDSDGAAFGGGSWRTHDGMDLAAIIKHLRARGRRFHRTESGYTLIERKTVCGEGVTYITDFRKA